MDNTPQAKKSLGQHWLTDTAALQAMCESAGVGQQDTVLEVGPGLGALTTLLVQRAHEVIAVELDKRLAAELPGRVPASNLQVETGSILEFDLTALPVGYKVVANIPYYLTSNLVRILSESPNPPAVAALLVQQEVAQRVAAPPGKMSLLSVTAQFYWQVSLGREIPARLFTPPPRVDSQILILTRRPVPVFDVDAKRFFRLVKAGFSQRRKTLLNSLGAGLRLSRSETEALIKRSGLEPRARAQELSLEQWHELYKNT